MLRTVALCKRLRDAAELERRLRSVDGVETVLVVTRTRRLPLFAGALAFDLLRLGPRGWSTVVALLARGRLRITSAALGGERAVRLLRSLDPDVGLHATPVIYRRNVLECFRLGILNPHIGLLPRYRGRSVMEWSILQGDPTGITTFFMDEGIDTGPRIVLRREVPVTHFGSAAAAKAHLFGLAGDMYAEALALLRQPDFTPLRQELGEGTRWYVMSRALAAVVDELLARDFDGDRTELLALALERRLAEVGVTGSAAGPVRSSPLEADDEEALRVLMVRLWPRVTAAAESPDELRSFFDHLAALRSAAEGGDLRFLDAFNCAYEALARRRWDDAEARGLVDGFLLDYRNLLARRLESMRAQ